MSDNEVVAYWNFIQCSREWQGDTNSTHYSEEGNVAEELKLRRIPFEAGKRIVLPSTKSVPMAEIDGVCNFVMNLKPIMEKIRDKKKLTQGNLQDILNFYLEVCHLVSKKD
jgi:hypothetical protein